MACVLVIDDDDDVRRSLDKILSRAGHQVLDAADGAQGLRLIQEHDPDVVVTDVYMPEMDGIELLIRIQDGHPELPLVVISGGGFASADFVLEDAARLGAAAILSKPFEPSVVVDTVRRVLKEADEG